MVYTEDNNDGCFLNEMHTEIFKQQLLNCGRMLEKHAYAKDGRTIWYCSFGTYLDDVGTGVDLGFYYAVTTTQ